MAINGIQFQKGLSVAKFMEAYGTQAQCEAALIRARWPSGFRCPRCGGEHASEFMRATMRYWQCRSCRHQTSLISGTGLEHTRLALTHVVPGHLPGSSSRPKAKQAAKSMRSSG